MRRGLLLLLALLAGCAQRDADLPTYGVVSDFSLTAQTGASFASSQLRGKVWVADFIFTNCPGPCPRMTTQMRQVQQETSSDVHLVSFTVDPARDTPETLAAYATRMKADTQRWHFLTGPQADLHRLKRQTFLLGDVDGSLQHSTRFVLVDARGHIRGFYPTDDDQGLKQLVTDIRKLAHAANS